MHSKVACLRSAASRINHMFNYGERRRRDATRRTLSPIVEVYINLRLNNRKNYAMGYKRPKPCCVCVTLVSPNKHGECHEYRECKRDTKAQFPSQRHMMYGPVKNFL
jgi:hypothetical protein